MAFYFGLHESRRATTVCRDFSCFLLWGVFFFLLGLSAGRASADDAPALLTGSAFQRGVAQQAKVAWRNAPLRDALDSLEHQTRLAIWLDRRIDPGQLIDFNANNEPIEQLLKRLANQIGAGAVVLDSVVYFGPAKAAAALADVLKERKRELRQLPAEIQRRFAKKTANQWRDLATPRELLDALQTQRRIRISGVEQIPHDLWAARRLPPLGLVDQLQLILVGFNTTFRFENNGKTLVLTPLP